MQCLAVPENLCAPTFREKIPASKGQAVEAKKVEAEAKVEADKVAKEKTDKEAVELKAKEEKLSKEAEEKATAVAAKEAEDKKAAEVKAKADAEVKSKEDAINKETLDNDKDYKVLSEAEQRNILDKLEKREVTIEQTLINLKERTQTKRDAIANELKAQQGVNMTEKELLVKRESNVKAFVLEGNHETSQMRSVGAAELKEDAKTVGHDIAKRNLATIKENKMTSTELAIMGISKRSLTGADAASGALIIPVSTQNTIIGEGAVAFPEIDGATSFSARGLEETKLPISVNAGGEATEKAEGEDSDEMDSTVVKLQMALSRFSNRFKYNPLLAEHAPFVSQKTVELNNLQIRAIQKKFYINLVKNAAVTFDSIKATYDGGITSDASIVSEAVATVTAADLDNLITRELGKTGTITKSEYVFRMKPETYTAIVKAEKAAKVANSMFELVDGDVTIQGYDGIKVITSNYFVGGSTTGDIAVILSKKSSVAKYAGFSILKDSVEVEFKTDMYTRQLTTRMNLKHADPMYAVSALKVK